MAHEPGLACGPLVSPRRVYDRTRSARPGPNRSSRVGKMKKVVKRRGVGVLDFAEEKFPGVQGRRLGLGRFRRLDLCVGWSSVVGIGSRVGQSRSGLG